jgi:hypothetical protein
VTAAPRAPIRTPRLVLEPASHAPDGDLFQAPLASRAELLPWMAWARGALGARRIVLHAGTENRRSLAVAERLGFVRDGELEGGMTGGSVTVFPACSHHLDL